ncbi:SAF domain-containing protein [Falsibacillus albus]|uniref:Flp pilus assembly protein CpaB n=1 Tax=Falsibacillus albus TaxID=2478915 RepID=A0A3L7JK65_9BACI|nr:SAF domain-containing protein [Falsibacillus albus]RLQ91188.1 flp pilus assembly protein CpaB [Falsibacillus albus]
MLESKRRAAIFLLLAFILAAAAGYLVLDKVKSLNSELGGMTKIYIAKDDIPPRTPITESQIGVMEIPNRFVVENSYITDKGDLAGKVSVVSLSEGEIITQNMLKPISNLRNENNRLVAIQMSDKIQFDQEIKALDRVDIVVSVDDNGKKTTKYFLRDVPVDWAQGKGKNFAGIAVEVSAEDAPKLIHMENYADKIRILKANVGKEEAGTEQAAVDESSEITTDANGDQKDSEKQPAGKTETKKPAPATTTNKSKSKKP